MEKYSNTSATDLLNAMLVSLSMELDCEDRKEFVKDAIKAMHIDEDALIMELKGGLSFNDKADMIVDLFDSIEKEERQSEVLEDMVANNLSFLQRERLKEVLKRED